MISKFIKFGVVGFSGLFVDFGLTYFTKEKLHIPKYVANAIGFMSAATSNYFLNRIWTFESHNPEIMLEYSQFILISIIGLVINTFILWLLVSRFKFNFYLAKVFAIGVVTIWNFFANLFITFSPDALL
ncbi:MAG: GtrA family protein [Bacteroidales bacterium]|nr:GtrA family protein [Bacteroidota bacterium]MCF8347483.1 GtrA family protein [Bacteroidales bacterium]